MKIGDRLYCHTDYSDPNRVGISILIGNYYVILNIDIILDKIFVTIVGENGFLYVFRSDGNFLDDEKWINVFGYVDIVKKVEEIAKIGDYFYVEKEYRKRKLDKLDKLENK